MPKVTTRSLYPECIANLKLPIDAFYRESRSGVNIVKRNITTGLFGLVSTRKLTFDFVRNDISNKGTTARLNETRFGPNTKSSPIYLGPKYLDTF